jgi:DNA modification methylase
MEKLEVNKIYHIDCMDGMREMESNSVDFTLTDIPYNAVNRKSNGLRNLDKEDADILNFDLNTFLEEIFRVTKNSICIFCGKEEFSGIYAYFAAKKGTVRPIIWEKTNPSPMNGQYVYESGIEMAVWFKKSGASVFNAFCKNTVFRYPNGKRNIHPTQKNPQLFQELILDNSNEGGIIFDPCIGSGTTAIAAMETNRNFIGFEINEKYFEKAVERIKRIYKERIIL